MPTLEEDIDTDGMLQAYWAGKHGTRVSDVTKRL